MNLCNVTFMSSYLISVYCLRACIMVHLICCWLKIFFAIWTVFFVLFEGQWLSIILRCVIVDIARSKHSGKCEYHRNWEINIE